MENEQATFLTVSGSHAAHGDGSKECKSEASVTTARREAYPTGW